MVNWLWYCSCWEEPWWKLMIWETWLKKKNKVILKSLVKMNNAYDFFPLGDSLHYWLNKTEYTATEVACGWAWAIFKVTKSFRQKQWYRIIKVIKKVKKVKCDQPTDRLTDKLGCRIACTRLKIYLNKMIQDFIVSKIRRIRISQDNFSFIPFPFFKFSTINRLSIFNHHFLSELIPWS